MVTVRQALWHLPSTWQDQLLQAVVGKAERDEIGSALQRIYAFESAAGLELEFWFEGCTDQEAARRASAVIRDAAASTAQVA